MILIAESGSTKTDWLLLDEQNEKSFSSAGYNPQVINKDFLITDLSDSFPDDIDKQNIEEVHFYGAGCSSFSSKNKMKDLLKSFFPNSILYIESDLLAACRALLGSNNGIVGILGTGSNACYYDGQEIVQNSTNLGFLMGDEGSGNQIAQRVIKLCLYNKIERSISNQIIDSTLSKNEFVSSIYSQTRINQYLASFMPKILPFKSHDLIKGQILESFSEYFENHISIYSESSNIYLVGSIAHLFKQELEVIASNFNKVLVKVIKSPIQELKEYHLKS